jgi:hypothetical protein
MTGHRRRTGQLPDPAQFSGLTLRTATRLAAYTLGSVNGSITGCGGMSAYMLHRNAGSAGHRTVNASLGRKKMGEGEDEIM